MIEFLKNLINPVNIAIVVGILAVLRVIGESLIAIGKLKEGKDKFDTLGAKILRGVGFIGKLFAYFGIGNSKKWIFI